MLYLQIAVTDNHSEPLLKMILIPAFMERLFNTVHNIAEKKSEFKNMYKVFHEPYASGKTLKDSRSMNGNQPPLPVCASPVNRIEVLSFLSSFY